MVVRGMILAHTVPISILDVDAAINQDLKALIPKRELDTSFLAAMLRAQQATILSQVGTAAHGTKKLDSRVLENLRIPFPPVAEQRRIAAILDHADGFRTKRRQITAQFDDLLQAVFDEMFARQEWPTQRLDAITDPTDRMNYGIVQPGVDVRDGIPMIRVTDMMDGVVDRSALKRVATHVDAKHRRSTIRGTEVLVSSVGTLGRVAVTSQADIGSNVNRAIVRVPISDPILRRYVAGYLQTAVPQRYFRQEARTVAQATLNVREVASLQIPLPKRDLQAKFVELYEVIVDRKAVATGAVRLQDRLFASLQSRAFRGEL
jgi:type I restriction enzyme S subunit